MNHLLDNAEDEDQRTRRDREITLGTTTLLGIFFGLAILCAGFFGFGYSMGSKHTTIAAVTPNGDAITVRNISGAKPSGGNPYAAPGNSGQSASTDSKTAGKSDATPYVAPEPASVKTVSVPAAGTTAPPEAFETTDPPNAKNVKVSAMPAAAPTPALVAATPAVAPTAGTGQSFVVQVAALSHQDDADMIQTTLKRRGYAVVVRQDANDHLLHVQLGPFGSKKDAETMRQRLLADGFNAYIK